jgi:hypothetical protein
MSLSLWLGAWCILGVPLPNEMAGPSRKAPLIVLHVPLSLGMRTAITVQTHWQHASSSG